MNRAAEQAAPEAKQIFWGAVIKMKFEDAQKILGGPGTAATSYFKYNTYAGLQNIFKPIVKEIMGQVGVPRQFQDINNKLASIPLADKASVELDQYVTDKSLKGCFLCWLKRKKRSVKIQRHALAIF